MINVSIVFEMDPTQIKIQLAYSWGAYSGFRQSFLFESHYSNTFYIMFFETRKIYQSLKT
jgi:hypothetical protein